MNILRKLSLRAKSGDSAEYKHLKRMEKYRDNLSTIEPPLLHFPSQRPLTFKHSGNCGDIIYAIPAMRAIAGEEKICLQLHIDQPAGYAKHIRHPLGKVMLNQRMFEQLRPLILAQPEFGSCELYTGGPVDIDLDKMREYPLLLDRGNIARWYFLIFPVNFDLNRAWLSVQPDPGVRDAIVIARSRRYRAPEVSYRFLQKYSEVYFIGLEDEYADMRGMVPGIRYRPVKDFYEMAAVIAGSRLFIGNQSFPFSLAEALKVNRLLEVHFECPNVTVYGDRGYDFCFQPQFEKLVSVRYESI